MWIHRVMWATTIAMYGLVGVVGLLILAPNTFPGADLAVFQQAGRDLIVFGDPYASNDTAHYNFQYRYPPLLAIVIPLLGWPPLWYPLLVASTAAVFYFWWRDAGWFGILPIVMMSGAWGQVLINGNVQPILMFLLALVPRFHRIGAVSLAVGTMLKLHPALGAIWYLGRRDWRGLGWYTGAIGVLLLVQAPWLDDFARYYLTDADASITLYRGWGLRIAGDVAWIIGTVITGVLAWRFAATRYGWMLNIVFQLAALPRFLPTNLALLLSAPLPSRQTARQSRTQTEPTSPS